MTQQMKRARGMRAGMLGGIAFGVVAALGLGVGLGAGVASRLAEPTSVAVVDIDRVSGELEEFSVRVAEIKTKQDARVAELQSIADRINEIGVEVESLTPEQSARRIQLAIDEQVSRNDLQTKQQLYQQEGDLLQAELTRSLYAKIIEATEEIAERDGFDIVLFDDRSISLNEPSAASFVGSVNTIKLKKMLFASETVDLTPSVLAKMNNDFAAGG